MWITLFVLLFILSGCDFLPCFHGLSSLDMWDTLVRGLRVRDLFPKPLLTFEDGKVTVEEEEVVKFLAVAFYCKREPAFSAEARSAKHPPQPDRGGYYSVRDLGEVPAVGNRI